MHSCKRLHRMAHETDLEQLKRVDVAMRATSSRRSGTHRDIDALELLEVSLVRHPMQPLARVHKLAA